MSDRKYRQKGYMEDDRPEPRRGRGSGPRPERQGPRGRGLGAPTADVVRCAACGQKATPAGRLEFAAACTACGADLHTCTNCRHFDPSARWECREPVEQRVGAKASNNECQLFEPKLTREFASDSARPADPKAAFDALFKL